MQPTSALKRVDVDYQPIVSDEKRDDGPQFGQRKSRQAVAEKKAVRKIVVEERVIRLQSPEEREEEKFASKREDPGLSLFHSNVTEHKKALVPTILNDVLSNILTYVLILCLTTLAVFKVHQVQMTRDMTVQYNEVSKHNDNLEKERLSLLSDRAALTEYSIIREHASANLHMVQPKTEEEVVIDLR